jgi:hypothetical protein
MAVYTVHEPPPRRGEAAADPERFAFVRDGFHFWAFLLGPLWMLRRRLWLVLILYLLLVIVLQVGLWFVGAGGWLKFIAGVLLAMLVGLEAPTLRRWTLGRRGWLTVGVVVADDLEMAERRFFDRWVDRPQPVNVPPPSVAAPLYAAAGSHDEVFGLFPQPGWPR